MPKRNNKPRQSPLSGRLALITGANRGIGLAIARALAREGCNLIITGRDERTLAKTRIELEKLRVQVLAQPCDVRSPDSVDHLFVRVRALRRPLGSSSTMPASPTQPRSRRLALSNMDGGDRHQSQWPVSDDAGGPGSDEAGKHIVNNLSVAAERIFPGSAAYNASKHGALGFTDTLREELRPKGIRVIALLPGATDTEIWQTLWPTAPRRKMMSA